MAPGKFGLFKARSREYQEQPSTENLLQYSASSETVDPPPIASTSYTTPEELAAMEMAALRIDCEAEVMAEDVDATRRSSECSKRDTQIKYRKLQRQHSTDVSRSSTTTLQSDSLDEILSYEQHELQNFSSGEFDDGASTLCDAHSIQFDETSSIAPSEDVSVRCGGTKKAKKTSLKVEQLMRRDLDMWKATDFEVMHNLLSRSGTLDDQLKWEVIATARGLCALNDTCACDDCLRAKYLQGVVMDGDGGLGAAAPVLNNIQIGCIVI